MEATTSRTQLPTAMLRENLDIMRHELTLSARALAILEGGDADQAESTCPCCGGKLAAGTGRQPAANGRAKATRRATARKPTARRANSRKGARRGRPPAETPSEPALT